MKVYGYSKNGGDILQDMEEITLRCNASELRAIASLILKCANNKNWEHLHLQDEWEGWVENMTDVIIQNPNKSN